MTLQALREIFRFYANDVAEPQLASDEVINGWLNEAQDEACVRARLLHESQNDEVCRVEVSQGQRYVPLHARLLEVDYLAFAPSSGAPAQRLQLCSQEWLDSHCSGWRMRQGFLPFAILDERKLRLATGAPEAGAVALEGYRMAMEPMHADDDSPEIHEAQHRHLVAWALWRFYSVQDAEMLDKAKAEQALAEFEGVFGARPSSNLRRNTQEDVPHHVEPHLP